jgi:hypothetical protein
MEGIINANANALVSVISDECEAIRYAVGNAREGAFIVVCSEHVKETLEFVRQLYEGQKCENNIDEDSLNMQLQAK